MTSRAQACGRGTRRVQTREPVARTLRAQRSGTMLLHLSLYLDPALIAAAMQIAAQCLLLRRR